MEAKNATCKFNTKLFQEWNELSAYILGYLEADGTFLLDENTIRITFAASDKDREFIEMLASKIEFTGKVSTRKFILKQNGKQYGHTRFTVSSRTWKKNLEAIDFRNDRIPKVPKQYLHHYIRGYFDGDGSVYFEKQSQRYKSSFVFSSKTLATSFKNILELHEIKASNIHVKTNSKHCWYFTLSYQQTERLGKFMYKNSSIYMSRKYQTFAKAIELRRILQSHISQK